MRGAVVSACVDSEKKGEGRGGWVKRVVVDTYV